MLCNLVNFISDNWELEVGQGWQQGEEKTRQKKKGKNPSGQGKEVQRGGSVTTTTDSTMSSNVPSVQSLCRHEDPGEGGAQQRGGEDKIKRPARSMCCPFIGVFVHAQIMSAYMQFVPCMLPA